MAEAQNIYAHAALNYKTERETVLVEAISPLACPIRSARAPSLF